VGILFAQPSNAEVYPSIPRIVTIDDRNREKENSEQDALDLARDLYQAGRNAFERGSYRQSVEYLEEAVSLAGQNSSLGGEVQIWLVNAYSAADRTTEAIGLCEQLERHPSFKTRKQSRRLLYILKAPQLKRRQEWLTQIPDLSNINEAGSEDKVVSARYTPSMTKRVARPKTEPELEEIDLSQVNTQENRFVWVALIGIALTIGGLLWFS
jgi:tetratricopeptide (TPR) repeat protein